MSTPEIPNAPTSPTTRSRSPAVTISASPTLSGAAKIHDQHRARKAIVYIRQSSPQQVTENKESTARQYALADVAVALGWPRDRVEVIDRDQGHSGKTAEGRPGFQ